MSDLTEEVGSKLYDYSLVSIVHRGRPRHVEKFFIVPTDWLSMNNKKLVTKYMDDPIEGEGVTLLEDFIKNKVDAPPDWPLHRVKIIDCADNYLEACKKLEILINQDSVLTAGSTKNIEDFQTRIMNALQQRDLLKTQADLFKKMNDGLLPEVVATEPLQIGSTVKNQTSISNLPSEVLAIEPLQNASTVKDHIVKSTDEVLKKERVSNVDTPDPNTTQVNNETLKPILVNNEIHSVAASHSPIDMNVSVLHFTNTYECKNDFERAVMDQFLQVRAEMSNLNQRLDNIEHFLMDKKIVSISNKKINFKEKYNLNIPLNTVEEFNKFNSDLETNTFLSHDVMTVLHSLVNADSSITKSYVNMLKKFFTKNLAKNCTASRKGANASKIILKKTEFCKCMDLVIKSKRKHENKETEDKDLASGLSDVLCNVNNWKSPD